MASCNSTLAPILSTNAANIDKTLLKTTPLKETDLKRWSHLDIVKDTVPGMSIDKAYADLLKNKKGCYLAILKAYTKPEPPGLPSVLMYNVPFGAKHIPSGCNKISLSIN